MRAGCKLGRRCFLADDDRRERFFDMFFSPVLERGDGMFTGLGSRVPEARCIDGE